MNITKQQFIVGIIVCVIISIITGAISSIVADRKDQAGTDRIVQFINDHAENTEKARRIIELINEQQEILPVEIIKEQVNQIINEQRADRRLSHNEFLELIGLYNAEIRKTNLTGRDFILRNINQDNTIIDRLDESILN